MRGTFLFVGLVIWTLFVYAVAGAYAVINHPEWFDVACLASLVFAVCTFLPVAYAVMRLRPDVPVRQRELVEDAGRFILG